MENTSFIEENMEETMRFSELDILPSEHEESVTELKKISKNNHNLVYNFIKKNSKNVKYHTSLEESNSKYLNMLYKLLNKCKNALNIVDNHITVLKEEIEKLKLEKLIQVQNAKINKTFDSLKKQINNDFNVKKLSLDKKLNDMNNAWSDFNQTKITVTTEINCVNRYLNHFKNETNEVVITMHDYNSLYRLFSQNSKFCESEQVKKRITNALSHFKSYYPDLTLEYGKIEESTNGGWYYTWQIIFCFKDKNGFNMTYITPEY